MKRQSITSIAQIFGVPRQTLTRRLEQAGLAPTDGATIREAFQAWTRREAIEDARRRKNTSEADIAELTLAERKGEIKKRLEFVVADYAKFVRTTISRSEYILLESRKRLCNDLAAVRDIRAAIAR